MKLILIMIIFFCLSCSPQNDGKRYSNIIITNNDFKILLQEFPNSPYISNSDRTGFFSVSITIDQNDTTIGFYANQQLLFEYYIGCIQTDTNTIYFYADEKKSIKGLYDVISKPKIMADSIYNDIGSFPDYKETYRKYYYYRNEKFVLQGSGNISE